MCRNTENTKGSFVLKGDLCYNIVPEKMETVKDGYLVCIDGKSAGVFASLPEEYSQLELYDYSGQLIIPGMVDLHIHAPQFAFRGLGMDMELMDWLQNHTFPEEAKYEDLEYADKAYGIFAEAMKNSVTTHACIFATKHREATKLLMEKMEATGIISYVGKVNMDREAPPELCEPSADHSAFDTFGWINDINGKFKRTMPILTPRFIPCCTPELLIQLKEIQRAYDLPVQSHLSENKGEVDFVRILSPEAEFYGDAYDNFSLFGEHHDTGQPIRTIMAHCVYSSDEEMNRMKENGVYVAHCPTSNMNLSSGIAPIRKFMENGLNIGIGTDVAGGHTESMMSAMCDTIQVSKLYWRLGDEGDRPLTFPESFYLATKGGGSFFGKVGSFEEGYDFSAVVLNDGLMKYPFGRTIQERLECAAYGCLDLYGITGKYVSGTKII